MTLALQAALVIREYFTALIITLFVLVVEIFKASRSAEDSRRSPICCGPAFDQWTARCCQDRRQSKPNGAIEVRVEHVGEETTYGRIVEAVEKAEHSRAPIQKTADRPDGYPVYFALGAALLTFLITHNARSTISVIIVAGACGIAAGTPLGHSGRGGSAARQGAIIKGGLYLELLAPIDTVLLDKTGTLTLGIPSAEQVSSAGDHSTIELRQLAASVENLSEHPLAAAVQKAAKQQQCELLEASEFQYVVGRGVSATVEGRLVRIGSAAFHAEQGVAVPAIENEHGTALVIVSDRDFIGVLVIWRFATSGGGTGGGGSACNGFVAGTAHR